MTNCLTLELQALGVFNPRNPAQGIQRADDGMRIPGWAASVQPITNVHLALAPHSSFHGKANIVFAAFAMHQP